MRRVVLRTLLLTSTVLVVPLVCSGYAGAATLCKNPDFNVNIGVLSNDVKSPPAAFPGSARLPGGVLQLEGGVTLTTGKLVESFQNASTLAPPIVLNVSGPNWVTYDPTTRTGVFVGTGYNAFTVGPNSQTYIGPLPGLIFTKGLVTLNFTVPTGGGNPIATSFSLDGTLVDGCALLAG